jgi:hypothetical protein
VRLHALPRGEGPAMSRPRGLPNAVVDELYAAVAAIRADLIAARRRGLEPRESDTLNEVVDAAARLLMLARFRLREIVAPPPRRGRTR